MKKNISKKKLLRMKTKNTTKMKIQNRYRLAALCALLTCSSLCAYAQVDDGVLYYPPKLVVQTYADEAFWYRMYNTTEEEIFEEKEQPKSGIYFTRRYSQETLIPLPVIFYDQGSYVIPERYQQFTGSSEADRYIDSAELEESKDWRRADDLPKYYEILNVIGYRLAEARSTTISLEGGYSTEPGENEEVAIERAQVIFEYLTTIWHIEPERIAILPPRRLCDSSANVFRQEESRRVAFYTDNADLLRPVNYTISKIDGSTIFFSLFIDPQMSPENISSMELMIASGEDILGRTSIPVSYDSTTYRLQAMWFLPRDLKNIEEKLTVQLFVRTIDGTVRASDQTFVPVIIQDEEPIEVEPDYPSIAPSVEESEEGEYYESDYEYDEETEYVEEDYPDYVDVDTTAAEDIPAPDYPAYYDYEPFYASIPFFEASDTGLTRLQETWVRSCLDTITQRIASLSGGRWALRVIGEGESAELPGTDNAQLATMLSTYRSLQNYYYGLIEDPTFQMSLYFIDPAVMARAGDNDGGDGMWNSIIDAWYGDRAGEIKQRGKEWEDIVSKTNHSDEERAQADTFLTHRAAGVARYFQSRFDTAVIDTILPKAKGWYYGSYQTHEYTPEGRFYKRRIEISLEPSYYYEVDESEGTEYYGEEYEEGEEPEYDVTEEVEEEVPIESDEPYEEEDEESP